MLWFFVGLCGGAWGPGVWVSGICSVCLVFFLGVVCFLVFGVVCLLYLWDESAARNIHRACPAARIVIILRDPVDRAYSQYLMNVKTGLEDLPPLQAIQRDMQRESLGWWDARLYVGLGRYEVQIRRYFDTFGRDQVAVYSFAELKRNPRLVFQQIAEHIGVDPRPLEHMDVSKAENAFRMPRSPLLQRVAQSSISRRIRHAVLPESVRCWMQTTAVFYKSSKPSQDRESKLYLQQIYEAEIRGVERLLGREMPELRHSWV